MHKSPEDPSRPFMNLTGSDTTNKEYLQRSSVYQADSSHAGEDVPVYAIGKLINFIIIKCLQRKKKNRFNLQTDG